MCSNDKSKEGSAPIEKPNPSDTLVTKEKYIQTKVHLNFNPFAIQKLMLFFTNWVPKPAICYFSYNLGIFMLATEPNNFPKQN